jgi:hypothetical protein
MERTRTFLDQDNRISTIQKNVPINDVSISHGKKVTKKWHFRPRSIWPFVMWGLVLFAGLKITIIPLVEGIYYYIASTSEIHQLKNQYTNIQKQMGAIRKKRDYMKTPSYVEERAHEIGLVKSEESQMVVAEGVPDDELFVKKNGAKKKTAVRN